MVGQLTTTQFGELCKQFGKDNFHRRPVDVRPTQAQIKGQLKPIIKWLEAGMIDLKSFISDYFSFEDILMAFEQLENRGISKKGIVVYPR